MANTEQRICKILGQQRYKEVTAKKENGTWSIRAFDPFNECWVEFPNAGRSLEAVAVTLSSAPVIPDFRVSYQSDICKACGTVDHVIAFDDLRTGDFVHRCRSCKNEWVVYTAAEQEEDARQRMEEALEIVNPVLSEFMKGKLKG